MHYLLFYEVADDYSSRRAEFRDAHLEKAWRASECGELVLGGALADPVDAAVLLFKGDSPEVAEKFAKVDPYVINGVVKRWYVRPWTTVAGETASTPVRPNAAVTGNKTAGEPSGSDIKDPSHQAQGMVLRMWKARSTVGNEHQYVEHATTKVFPALRAIEGHRGAYLLRRALDDATEFVVFTLWESMAAVRRFAGAKPEKAVVEPEAQAVLADFDDSVTHFEVVYRTEAKAK